MDLSQESINNSRFSISQLSRRHSQGPYILQVFYSSFVQFIMSTDKQPGGKRRYTLEEDDRLLQLISETRTAASLRGNSVWKDYINTNSFPDRTWQSLKERFIKRIVPDILEGGFQTPLYDRKLILVDWMQTAKDYPTNIPRKWLEVFQWAREASLSFDSDEDEEVGITVSDECKSACEEIVKYKKLRYAIFHIKNQQIDVEFVGAREEDYDEFLTDLQIGGDSECRYGLYDLEYRSDAAGPSTAATDTTGSTTRKLFLMLWCPHTATDETKNLYKRSFNVIKKYLTDVTDYVEATDISEAVLSVVKAKLRRNATTAQERPSTTTLSRRPEEEEVDEIQVVSSDDEVILIDD